MPFTYLDNSATTRVCREAARKAFDLMTADFGNPSSLHSLGFRAEQEMETARKSVAAFIGCPTDCLVFTSGGTEANNLAVLGGTAAYSRRGKHIITTAVEHPSVSVACDALEKEGYEITRLVPDSDGMITSAALAEVLRPDTVLVSIMMVNNETGALFPIADLVKTVRRLSPHALFHCDAVQAAGKLAVNAARLGVDFLTVSAHKLHAPKGCGALYIRKGVRVLPRLLGGGQEKGIRSGTESTPLIAAFGEAVRRLPTPQYQQQHFEDLYHRLTEGLTRSGGFVIRKPAVHVPYICNFSMPGYRSETLLHFLAERDIFVSSGSACSKGKKSAVLTAMGISQAEIDSALRISFCMENTADDVDRLLTALSEARESLAHT